MQATGIWTTSSGRVKDSALKAVDDKRSCAPVDQSSMPAGHQARVVYIAAQPHCQISSVHGVPKAWVRVPRARQGHKLGLYASREKRF